MDICTYLDTNGVVYTAQEHPEAFTAQEIAAETHVSGIMVAKPVIICDEDGFAMCVIPACFRLDLDKVAESRGTYNVRLADEWEMAELFQDCELGAEPPFGNLYRLPTMVDKRLAEDMEIVFEAGTHHQAIRMSYADFERLAQPDVYDLTMDF